MIPTDLVGRMKVVADFDSLILRHMMIELGVQTFCRPAGAASEILTMFEESFRQDREPALQPSNGHVKRGRPALPKPEESSDDAGPKNKAEANKRWYEAAAARKAQDPWNTADWRKEIFRFAAEHGGVFTFSGYGSYYSAKYKRNLTDTHARGTVSDMKDRQHFLRKVGKGKFAVTDAGKKAAAELGISFSVTSAVKKAAPAKKSAPVKKAAPAKKAAPVKKKPVPKGHHQRPPAEGPATPAMLERFAADHDGDIFTNDFIKEHKTSAGSTYAQLANLQTQGRVEKVKPGHFRVIQREAAASA